MEEKVLVERLNYCEVDKRVTNWIPRLVHFHNRICSAYQCEVCDSIASEHYLDEIQRRSRLENERPAGDERSIS